MRISKRRLKRLIKEEVKKLLNEARIPPFLKQDVGNVLADVTDRDMEVAETVVDAIKRLGGRIQHMEWKSNRVLYPELVIGFGGIGHDNEDQFISVFHHVRNNLVSIKYGLGFKVFAQINIPADSSLSVVARTVREVFDEGMGGVETKIGEMSDGERIKNVLLPMYVEKLRKAGLDAIINKDDQVYVPNITDQPWSHVMDYGAIRYNTIHNNVMVGDVFPENMTPIYSGHDLPINKLENASPRELANDFLETIEYGVDTLTDWRDEAPFDYDIDTPMR